MDIADIEIAWKDARIALSLLKDTARQKIWFKISRTDGLLAALAKDKSEAGRENAAKRLGQKRRRRASSVEKWQL